MGGAGCAARGCGGSTQPVKRRSDAPCEAARVRHPKAACLPGSGVCVEYARMLALGGAITVDPQLQPAFERPPT